MTKTPHIYIIRDKIDGQYVVCNGHCAWKNSYRAINSWNISFMTYNREQKPWDKAYLL